MPNVEQQGEWSKKYADRIEQAGKTITVCDSIADKISAIKKLANRNVYNLSVYEQVNKLVRFSNQALIKLYNYDQVNTLTERNESLNELSKLEEEFSKLRSEFELVYGKTRIIEKPDDYILDQDHHIHLANQSLSFDWQFYAELLFLKKLKSTML